MRERERDWTHTKNDFSAKNTCDDFLERERKESGKKKEEKRDKKTWKPEKKF